MIINRFKWLEGLASAVIELAKELNIPIISGHQLNREAARQVDDIVKAGGYNKTDQAMGRANVSVA